MAVIISKLDSDTCIESLKERDMGVYGIGLFFMRYFSNFDFNVRYCGIIRPCGMRYFIILADCIGGNMIVHGIVVRLFAFSFRYNTQSKTQ